MQIADDQHAPGNTTDPKLATTSRDDGNRPRLLTLVPTPTSNSVRVNGNAVLAIRSAMLHHLKGKLRRVMQLDALEILL
eukprot:10019852-Alexandrium_andersonii.AAC.1